MKTISVLQQEGLREDIPAFRPGDTLRVSVRVREGEKERLQAFEGVCIGRRGAGISETFAVWAGPPCQTVLSPQALRQSGSHPGAARGLSGSSYPRARMGALGQGV